MMLPQAFADGMMHRIIYSRCPRLVAGAYTSTTDPARGIFGIMWGNPPAVAQQPPENGSNVTGPEASCRVWFGAVLAP